MYDNLTDCPTCQSILKEIPENRTCYDANIPIYYCFCNVYKLVTSGEHVAKLKKAAKLHVNFMNEQIEKYRGDNVCRKVRRPKVLYGWEADGLLITIFETNLRGHVYQGALNLSEDRYSIVVRSHLLSQYSQLQLCGGDEIYEYCACAPKIQTTLRIPMTITTRHIQHGIFGNRFIVHHGGGRRRNYGQSWRAKVGVLIWGQIIYGVIIKI